MSDHDENLLDEDLGDDDYDLGNDEEDALLADDSELERQSSYKGEEETDDVLDLGVTDALDDLEGEEENIEYSSETDNRNQNDFYKEGQPNNGRNYYGQKEREEYNQEQNQVFEECEVADVENGPNSPNKLDLREKLQRNAQKDIFIGNGQGMEDDDCEEAKERRNRFQNERVIISPKMNNEIPDSLENVVTAEQPRLPFRGRGRGRGIRGIRGGRFIASNSGNFNPRFNGPRGLPPPYDGQHPPFRPPLLENRPPFPPGPRPNMPPNQQMPYPQNSPQVPSYQQFPTNAPPQGPPPFLDNRPPYNPNQFQGPMGPPGPRLIGSRPEFASRGPPQGPIPPYNYPPNQSPYHPNHQQFQTQGPPMQDNQGRPVPGDQGPPMQGNQDPHLQGNQGPPMQGNQGPPMQRNQGPLMQGNQGPPPMRGNQGPAMQGNQVPTMQGNQVPPMQGNQGPPPIRGSQGPLMQGSQGPPMQGNQGPPMQGNQGPPMQGNQGPPMQGNQGPPMQGNRGPLISDFPRPPIQVLPMQNHPNNSIPNQTPYENRPPFQDPHYEGRPVYDSRPVYNDQPPVSQYNNGPPILPQQSTPNVPNVPLPPGHKILINPHFRGAVQPTTDARLVWDSNVPQQQQQTPLQPQIPNEQFVQPPTPYQNQEHYNQPPPAPPQAAQDYNQPSFQQNKSDDPYAYFSDVWQENKPPKQPSVSTSNSYPSDSSYTRESYYNDYDNSYKGQSQWEHRDSYQQGQRGQQQSYRDRDPPPRPRVDHPRDSRLPSSNSNYRSESYDHGRTQRNPSNRPYSNTGRGMNRSPQKRVPEGSDRGQRDPSPKRAKMHSRNLHEVRTIDTLPDTTTDRREEENEDPEMREYRKKMEEQKRLRERLLREKENRRKMAALEKQTDEMKTDSSATDLPQQETKPVSVVTGVAKDAQMAKARPIAGRGRGRPGASQPTEGMERASGVRIVRTIQTVQTNPIIDNDNVQEVASAISTVQGNETARMRQVAQQPGMRRVVIHKPLPNTQRVATTIQKTVSNLQKGLGAGQQKIVGNVPHMIQKVAGIVQKVPVIPQKTPGNVQKSVAQKASGNLQKNMITQKVANTNTQMVVVNTQNNQRVVLQKTSPQARKPAEMKTNTLKIENLAASTTEAQIRRMCQGIGTLESIRMSEGSATIVFKTQSAAIMFHKKYQRKMLDLSLITVRLVPQTSGTKATTTVVKKS